MKALRAFETSDKLLVRQHGFTPHKTRNVNNRHVSIFHKAHSDHTVVVKKKLCVLCEVRSAVSYVTENKFRHERLHEATNKLLCVLTIQNQQKH
jgi:hypothetical protein